MSGERMSFGELQEMVSVCLDELIKLKQEKEMLQRKNAELEKLVMSIAESQKTVIGNVSQIGRASCRERVSINV